MIKDHIEAIQQEIREKYGLNARIEICVHRAMQDVVPDQGKATDFICATQPEINADITIGQGETCKWVECDNWVGQKRAVIFYD